MKYNGKANVKTPSHKEIPDGLIKKNKKKLFCPYCGEYTFFKGTGIDKSYKRCSGCGIGKGDFWVQKINKLFSMSLKPTGKGKGRK